MSVSKRTIAIEESCAEICASLIRLPNSEDVRFVIMKLLNRLASADESVAIQQLPKYVERVQTVFRDWPGIKELRACWCGLFPPADGQSVEPEDGGTLCVFMDRRAGDALSLEAEDRKRLPPGPAMALLNGARKDPRRERQDQRWQEICKGRPALMKNIPRLATEFGTTEDLDRRDAILNQLTGNRS